MSRPLTLIGIVVLVLAGTLYFLDLLAGDKLTVAFVIGVIILAAGLVTGR